MLFLERVESVHTEHLNPNKEPKTVHHTVKNQPFNIFLNSTIPLDPTFNISVSLLYAKSRDEIKFSNDSTAVSLEVMSIGENACTVQIRISALTSQMQKSLFTLRFDYVLNSVVSQMEVGEFRTYSKKSQINAKMGLVTKKRERSSNEVNDQGDQSFLLAELQKLKNSQAEMVGLLNSVVQMNMSMMYGGYGSFDPNFVYAKDQVPMSSPVFQDSVPQFEPQQQLQSDPEYVYAKDQVPMSSPVFQNSVPQFEPQQLQSDPEYVLLEKMRELSDAYKRLGDDRGHKFRKMCHEYKGEEQDVFFEMAHHGLGGDKASWECYNRDCPNLLAPDSMSSVGAWAFDVISNNDFM